MAISGVPPTNLIRLAAAAEAGRVLHEAEHEEEENAVEGRERDLVSRPAKWVALGVIVVILTLAMIVVTLLDNGSWLLGVGMLVVAIAVLLLGFALGLRRTKRREAA